MTMLEKRRKAAPQRLVFPPPRQRKVGIGVAAVFVGAAFAVAIGLLVAGGGSDEPAAAAPTGQIVDEGHMPYASSVALWNEFLTKQEAAAATLPYASSVALWNEFRTEQEAAAGIAD
ncbi:MAG: hypothetical protein HKN80_08160 [Acidimicrobiia bacterium]|nr:hypothetical protein [Acidimicrobiia bacterium]